MACTTKEVILDELRWQLSEAELSILFCIDYQDLDGLLYNLGLADGLRTMAAALSGDRTLLTFQRIP